MSVTSPTVLSPEQSDIEKSKKAPPARFKITPYITIPAWVFLSSATIMLNKNILSKGGYNFPYPIFLTSYHLLFATFCTRLMYLLGWRIMCDEFVDITWDQWFKNVLPIGFTFSGTLILGNVALQMLPIPTTQMLKSFTSMIVLFISIFLGVKKFSTRLFVIVSLVSTGLVIATVSESQFIPMGYLVQAIAIMLDATRLTLIQRLTQVVKLGPVVSLYYFAPVCLAFNTLPLLLKEGTAPITLLASQVGVHMLIGSAFIAFLLNVSVVFLVGSTSSLVLTLSSIAKNIVLIVGSVVFFHTQIGFMQILGYSLSLFGLFIYQSEELVNKWLGIIKEKPLLPTTLPTERDK
ncbi:hypothetical protein PROFUN_08075 [Planoprotostelium fungivorum]|uniref:Sugar phosphate transporter domain-containing protein n=1 Tax=Planoprotostelium fungivorum TaxID=1890364 RepID=A0A2P6NKI9_9EUKA|nr:hypothetical protein PROFUN_08075 [Planoprotostelium fungivorum]